MNANLLLEAIFDEAARRGVGFGVILRDNPEVFAWIAYWLGHE